MKAEDKPQTSTERAGLPQTVRRLILYSWASLSLERLYPVLWPAGGIVGLFLILALSNVFVHLPEWLHLMSLAAFVAGLVGSVMYSLRQSSIPSHAQAVRHLEQSSGLDHRPLSTLEDRPAAPPDDDAKALWKAHQRWIFNHLHKLRVAWPHFSLSGKDPHALRFLLFLVVGVLAAININEVPERLMTALSPGVAQGHVANTFEAWITAPSHTGEAPLHLTAKTSFNETELRVPKGSVLTVRTHGSSTAVMRVGSLGGPAPFQSRPEFLAAGGDARDAKLTIQSNVSVKLSLNAANAAAWRILVKDDLAPTIRFKSPVAVTQSQSLRLSYAVRDDYGVVAAWARFELAHKNDTVAGSAPFTLELPLPPVPARDGEAMIFKDLTSHIWAGLKVKVTLMARDGAQQMSKPHSVTVVLPERQFKEPLARALIEQRRSLSRDPRASGHVAKALDALSIAPERYTPDARIYLALRTAAFAARRVRIDASRIDLNRVASVQALLWDLAMRIEEGDAADAQAELRDVQQKLTQALARGAPSAEIDRLMAQLRAALERRLKALAQSQNGPPPMMQTQGGQIIRAEDLKSMLDQIEDLARQGSQAAAQQKLAELLNMLENVQPARAGTMTPDQKAAAESLEKLGQVLARQRNLMDKTFREQLDNDAAGRQKASPLQHEQEKLSNELSPLIKQSGKQNELSTALKRAQDAMDDAADQLGQGKLGSAGQAQQRALDELRQAGQAAAQQIIQQMAGGGGATPGSPGAGAGESEDPFGRPQSSFGPAFGDSVKVPDKLDIQKAREILEELQRRAAERGRPVEELEYLERLLRRF